MACPRLVKSSDSPIHRINRYPRDKYHENYIALSTVDTDLSGGYRFPPFEQLGPD